MKTNKLKEKIYICNIDFPNLELEKGNYFPTYRFTKEAIENAIKKGAIIEETLSQKTMKTNKLKEKKRLKTISDKDIEVLTIWECPYCKMENKEFGDYIMESDSDKIECSYCKKITRIREPKY